MFSTEPDFYRISEINGTAGRLDDSRSGQGNAGFVHNQNTRMYGATGAGHPGVMNVPVAIMGIGSGGGIPVEIMQILRVSLRRWRYLKGLSGSSG